MSLWSFSPTHEPLRREISYPCRPRSSTSCTDAAANAGIARSASVHSVDDGTVDDLHSGSSPTAASTPPVGGTPDRLAWRSASPERSRPGAFAYQSPTTPSTVEVGSCCARWLPHRTVAARSSLTPFTKRMSFAVNTASCAAYVVSTVPRGEPRYPHTMPAVWRPRRASLRTVSSGARRSAWTPLIVTRPAAAPNWSSRRYSEGRGDEGGGTPPGKRHFLPARGARRRPARRGAGRAAGRPGPPGAGT